MDSVIADLASAADWKLSDWEEFWKRIAQDGRITVPVLNSSQHGRNAGDEGTVPREDAGVPSAPSD